LPDTIVALASGEGAGETIHKPGEGTIQNSIDSKTKDFVSPVSPEWQPKVEIKRAGCEAIEANLRVVDPGQPMLITTHQQPVRRSRTKGRNYVRFSGFQRQKTYKLCEINQEIYLKDEHYGHSKVHKTHKAGELGDLAPLDESGAAATSQEMVVSDLWSQQQIMQQVQNDIHKNQSLSRINRFRSMSQTQKYKTYNKVVKSVNEFKVMHMHSKVNGDGRFDINKFKLGERGQ
jgi:hypothetical protein